MPRSHVSPVRSLRKHSSLSRFRFIGWLLALAALTLGVVAVWISPSSAQTSQQVNFRISRLETEVRMLQSQLNQLESQIGRGDRPSPMQPSAPNPDPGSLEDSMLASDPMFDRLATLVIETRQDVFALEERVEALEQQL